jgi:phosphatidylglycerophosphate synthase
MRLRVTAKSLTVSIMARRSPISRMAESRSFVDEVLRDLADGRWRAPAWGRFAARNLERSWDQARARRGAATELTALCLLCTAARPTPWLPTVWILALTHLGLLGERRSLGWANRLSLARAVLPGLLPATWRTAVIALATDFADGRIARRYGSTAFGSYADPLADLAFWSWFALSRERNTWLRWLPFALWWLPATAITVTYFARGQSVDYPRPLIVRYASGFLQVLLTLRAVTDRAGRSRLP